MSIPSIDMGFPILATSRPVDPKLQRRRWQMDIGDEAEGLTSLRPGICGPKAATGEEVQMATRMGRNWRGIRAIRRFKVDQARTLASSGRAGNCPVSTAEVGPILASCSLTGLADWQLPDDAVTPRR